MHALRLAALLVTLALSAPSTQPARLGERAYSGRGAWIDRYDYARLDDPEAAVAEMSVHGVRTLYLETASWRVPRNVDIVDYDKIERLVVAAHDLGMQVVAWYLPGLTQPRIDMRRVRAALAFQTADGQRFDSFALDIEATLVRPLRRRNARLLKLAHDIRTEIGDGYALGAIVPDERSTSHGDVLWPGFPYAALAKYFDVFLPMAYSTFNRASGARAVYAYTAANIRFVRRETGRRVHVIGGLTDAMAVPEEKAVARAARDAGAYGVSLYKYRLYDAGAWAALGVFEGSVGGYDPRQ
jgi:hypothetical protein